MMKFIVSLFGGKRTVDAMVADLERVKRDLLAHADHQFGRAEEHAAELARVAAAHEGAKEEAERATVIAANIGNLLGA